MKILYLSSFDISLGKGPSVNERTFLNSLNQKIEKLFCIHGKTTNTLNFNLKKSYSKIYSTQRHKFFFPFIELYKFIMTCYIIRKYKIDVIIARIELFPLSIFFLSLLYKRKIYIKTLGGGLLNSLSNNGFERLNLINNKLIKSILNRCIAVDTVSERFKSKIQKTFDLDSNKIHVIDNGVDLNMFKSIPGSKEIIKSKYKIDLLNYDYIIGYAGNLAYERGGEEVISAVNFLNKRFKNKTVAGLILGGGESDEILKKNNKDLNNIFFTGNILFEDLPLFISSFDIGFSILKPKNQGASAQKVRQYVASNVFTITTPGQEDFVEKFKIGKVFEYEKRDRINYYLEELFSNNLYKINSSEKVLKNISINTKVSQRLKIIKSSL